MSHFFTKLFLSFFLLPALHLHSQSTLDEERPRPAQTINKPIFSDKTGPLNPSWQIDIHKRMQDENIPGLSIAVRNKGREPFVMVFGATGFGKDAKSVTPVTLFQAASISKSLTTFGALILVQQGKLSLDKDVNNYLISWKIPDNEFTKNNKVTLRRLLSHTAGTSVWGFPGYRVDAKIPTLNQILDGLNPPANTPEIRVVNFPGKAQQYSGGGTTIVQKIIEDITGDPFDEWMMFNVLRPLGMAESTFEPFYDPAKNKNAAFGHYSNGKRVDGNWHVYPEQAAAGLWTTPSDLLKFVSYIETAYKVKTLYPLRSEYIKMMLTQQVAGGALTSSGLGCFMVPDGNSTRFYHDGRNEGFVSKYFGYVGSDLGVAVMSNSDGADGLLNEVAGELLQFLQASN